MGAKRMTMDESLCLDIEDWYKQLTKREDVVSITEGKEARIGDISVLWDRNVYETLRGLRAKIRDRVKSAAYDS